MAARTKRLSDGSRVEQLLGPAARAFPDARVYVAVDAGQVVAAAAWEVEAWADGPRAALGALVSESADRRHTYELARAMLAAAEAAGCRLGYFWTRDRATADLVRATVDTRNLTIALRERGRSPDTGEAVEWEVSFDVPTLAVLLEETLARLR